LCGSWRIRRRAGLSGFLSCALHGRHGFDSSSRRPADSIGSGGFLGAALRSSGAVYRRGTRGRLRGDLAHYPRPGWKGKRVDHAADCVGYGRTRWYRIRIAARLLQDGRRGQPLVGNGGGSRGRRGGPADRSAADAAQIAVARLLVHRHPGGPSGHSRQPSLYPGKPAGAIGRRGRHLLALSGRDHSAGFAGAARTSFAPAMGGHGAGAGGRGTAEPLTAKNTKACAFAQASTDSSALDAALIKASVYYLGSIGAEFTGVAAAVCCCTGGAGAGVGSLTPLMPSLNPFNPSPKPLPSSGSRLAPKSRNATTPSTIKCQG